MSKSIIDKNTKAFKNHQIIIAITTDIKKNSLDLAVVLKTNKDKKYYKILGYDTFESYLATPEISLSRFFVYKLIKNYEIWVEGYNVALAKLEDIDSEKLYMAGTIANENNYEEMLEKAKQLSRSDLSKEIKIARGEEEEVYIPEKKSYMVTCPHCGCKFEHFI